MKEKKETPPVAEETENITGDDAGEERQEVVHGISRAEVYSLAKNVSDIISAGKKVYDNRAVISERLNLLSLIFGLVYTALYIAYVVYSTVGNKLSMGYTIVGYVLIGVYIIVAVVLIILGLKKPDKNTNNTKRYCRALKVFRFTAKCVSIVIAILALVMNAVMKTSDSYSMAISTLLLVFSIIILVVQVIILVFGGIAGLCRWLLSPPKRKAKASVVTLEWYDNVMSGNADYKSTKKVDKNYVDDIGKAIDTEIIPALGKRNIGSFTSVDVLNIMDTVPKEDRLLCGGIFKNVFKYAVERGYIAENPCRDIDLLGNINEEEKKSLAKRISGAGKGALARGVKKVGMSLLTKFLEPDDE
ncbi:MAG: hypothetical protein LUD29_00520, partial [Clostridia bacterium]|nr:hypothetical protein [Clostridia bacterium]